MKIFSFLVKFILMVPKSTTGGSILISPSPHSLIMFIVLCGFMAGSPYKTLS